MLHGKINEIISSPFQFNWFLSTIYKGMAIIWSKKGPETCSDLIDGG